MKKLFNFENSILLFIFLLPLYLIRIRIGFFPTNLWELSFGALFIFWMIKTWPKINPRSIFRNYADIIFPAAVIFIGFIISTLAYPGNYSHSLGIIKSWFLIPIAFTVMAGSAFRQNISRVYATYFLSAAGVAALSLFYLFSGNLTYDGRLQAFFNSPNYLAMYLAPALIAALVQVKSSKLKVQSLNFKFKILLSRVSIFIIVISLYFTYSYAAWLAAIVSSTIIFFLTQRIKTGKLLAGFILLIGLIIVFQLNNDKFSDLIGISSRSSLTSRIVIWKSAVYMLRDNWIFGIGSGNFQAFYLDYQKYFPPYPEWAVPHPHNLYLSFWLSGGLLGIFGFLWLIYSYFAKLPEKIKKAGANPAVQKAAFVSCGIMIYILLHGVVDTTYFKNDLAVVFWLSFLALI